MKEPSQFNSTFGVLNVGSFMFVTLYVVAGVLCYWRWGDEVSGSVTLDLEINDK